MKDEVELLHDRYGRALFICAEADGTVDKVMEELASLNDEWLENRKFNRFLTHPLISQSEKKEVIEELVKRKKYCRTIVNFLKVLIDSRREYIIHGAFLRYTDLYYEFKKRIKIDVETPRTFTKEEKRSLLDMLKRKFKEEIEVGVKENPELISGISFQYKDRIYDYSIRGQLRRLEESMTA